MGPLFFFIGLPTLLVVLDFFAFIFTRKRLYSKFWLFVVNILSIIVLPALYLAVLDPAANDCCTDSATFSPDHKLTVYSFIILTVLAYFYLVFTKGVGTPILTVFSNSFLLFGIVFNCFLSYHVDAYLWIFGNMPIVMLFVIQLIQNHFFFIEQHKNISPTSASFFEHWIWKILNLPLLQKIPIFLILFLPIFVILSGILLLFGQKPDSMIRAFTDTYKHGFSQLDFLCENVQCGGHYLCSVAAGGHQEIVNPIRYGVRNGKLILCNRQLLISNAFEELIALKLPKIHRFVRRQYNKVGNLVHRYYFVFENKYVSDFIYLIMKPLEWFFLVVLYTFDSKPENRIAKQYLKPEDLEKMPI